MNIHLQKNKYNLHNQYKAIVIGGSAGSFQVVSKILECLPENFQVPIVMCLHRLKDVRNGFAEALNIKSAKIIEEPEDKTPIRKGKIYLAPANYHLGIELGNTFTLSTEEMFNNSRPAIDVTFMTAAYVFRNKLIGILLSGANRDGALGMQKIVEKGGLSIVQEPSECLIDTMPVAALERTQIEHTLHTEEIIDFLKQLHKCYT
ncbi:MAG: chemotaxis protein CheB [Thermonemataceae bacterium]|nr:chemotaxis protein CheB [Thermonemataceae bacterium]